MSAEDAAEVAVGRRGFLLAGLAGAVTLTVGGTTGLLVSAKPARAADMKVLDVTGDYAITDAQTGTQVSVTVRNGVRRIRANGLPNHATGTFPNAHNPNSISAQSYDYSLPASPTRNADSTAYALPQPFGIAINGVLFDPFAAEWWDRSTASWQYEALGGGIDLGVDQNHAHVQPNGAYHYHGIPTGLAATIKSGQHSPLVGWAGDGFPIYLNRGYRRPTDAKSGTRTLATSYQLKSGTRPDGPGGAYDGTYVLDWEYREGSGDLDAANGRFAVTPEYPRGTFVYILSPGVVEIPRRFAGTLAQSFVRNGPSAPGQLGRPPR